VQQLRDTLRTMLVANHDRADLDAATVAALADMVTWAGLSIRFTPQRSWRTADAGSGVRAAVGRLLGVVVTAMADGSWDRLKACGNDACRWGFYDTSRARTAKWCSMQICGNRMKQQAWRERTRGTG
jgi:predicted RNA-binding Zn ribbon-like protein